MFLMKKKCDSLPNVGIKHTLVNYRTFYKGSLLFQFVYLHPVHCHFDGIVVGVGRFHPCGANLHVNQQEVGWAEYVHYLRFAPC